MVKWNTSVEYYSTVKSDVSQYKYFCTVKMMSHNSYIWLINLAINVPNSYCVSDTRKRQTGALCSRNLCCRGEVGRELYISKWYQIVLSAMAETNSAKRSDNRKETSVDMLSNDELAGET